MSDSGRTHFDAAESGAICHDACAVAEIRRLLAERDALKAALRELVEADHLQQRANAINPLEPGCEKEILRDMAAQKRRTGMHNARALFAAPKEP